MNRSKNFTFVLLSIVSILASALISTSSVGASNPVIITSGPDEGAIKEIVQTYFEIRYHALSTLQLEGFGNLVSEQPDATDFLDAELGKLAIDVKHAELNRLRYVDYKFFLDFNDISIDEATGQARVSITVGHDVIYQISVDLDPKNPIISHAYNLKHTILLRREQGQWKIVSDNYTDLLWRILRQTGVSSDEMLQDMKASPTATLQNASTMLLETSCNFQTDESTHSYNREGAVNYAMTHIFEYNPNYPDYNSGDDALPWGDCTNFVSQALYEGGGVSMAVCGEPNSSPFCIEGPGGNLGWFFINNNFRASAWSDVGKLHEFVINYSTWDEGPEGCEVNINQVELGDVIQYKWDADEVWDHAVIVVDIIDGIPYVASHSEDAGPVPYTGPEYFTSYSDIRFIHIERSDGFGTVSTPTPPTPTLTPVPGSRGFYPNGIHVKYYNDVAPTQIFLDQPINWNTFTTLAAEDDVQTINYNWGTTPPAPGVNAVFWSARYEGQLLAPQSGNYTFFLDYLDDGGRLYIDGIAIIDEWLVQGPHFYSASISLTSGQHEIKIEYAQGPGQEGSLFVSWELPGVFAKELIGPASMGTVTPVPTTPVPTDTPTPIPTTPPPPSCTCIIFCDSSPSQSASSQSISPAYSGTPTPGVSTSEVLSSIVESIVDPIERATLIYRVRDELMSNTEEGQRLTDLYYEHSLEIATLMLAENDLYDQGFEALDAFLPGLQAIVDGNGDSVTITVDQVTAAQAFLDELSAIGSTELQQAILGEQENLPLVDMIGLSMDQAWIRLNGFPSTSVLDDFNRADGGIGSNWSGNTFGYTIFSNQLGIDYSGANSDIYWSSEPFGADQEVFVTLTDVDAGAWEHDLLLKVQSNSTWGDGLLEVLYDHPGQRVQVWTYEWPAEWVQHGADIPVTFVDGDQFGARALADGTVEVYRNGELLATRDITSWSHYADGGYVGLWFIGAEDAILDDFGGGTLPIGVQSMSMATGTFESQSAETSLTPEQLNVTLGGTDLFWQGLPIDSNQKAYVTFAQVNQSVDVLSKPQSNGAWGERVVEVLYDVAGGRIQIWMYDLQNGWVQYGTDIPVKFADGDQFSVRVLANGRLEIQQNGKSLAKVNITP